MRLLNLSFLFAILSLSAFVQASDYTPEQDIVLLEDMSLYNSINSKGISYQKSADTRYSEERNKNLERLKKQLMDSPEMSNLINPMISYLEENKTLESAKNDLPTLFLKLSKEIEKK